MTEGEKQVWAAAFVHRLNDFNDPAMWHVLRNASDRKTTQALRQLAMSAAEFADLAVNAMSRARKDLMRRKQTKTVGYQRLKEMLK